MKKLIIKEMITCIISFIFCYFGKLWNCYHVFIIYLLVALIVENELSKK